MPIVMPIETGVIQPAVERVKNPYVPSFRNPLIKAFSALAALLLLSILLARAFGPVRPLQNVVIERLRRNGVAAGISQDNPLSSSRIAEVSWTRNNRDVHVSLSPGWTSGPVLETTEFNGIRTERLATKLAIPTWAFSCSFNTVLFNYGPMTVRVNGADDPAAVIPEVHRLLECG